MTHIGLLVLFLPLIAIAQQPAESGDKSMILALESAWNQAEIHHDTNAAAALMADTFISVDHHGMLLNKAQYLAGLKTLPSVPRKSPIAKPAFTSMETQQSFRAPIAQRARTVESPSNTTAASPIPGFGEMESGSASPITKR